MYLHFVLDLWFEKKVRRWFRGEAYLTRFADDFVASFQYKRDAENFDRYLRKRFARFNLELADDKTRLLLFGQRFAELRAALLVQQVVGLRSLSEMQAQARGASEPDWVVQVWRDAAGTTWKELDLTQLAQNQRFLTVGL